MPLRLKHELVKRIQHLGWVYLTDNFVITAGSPPRVKQPKIKCEGVRITPNNCGRVQDFRDDPSRIDEYAKKIERNEIGLFAQSAGKMVGSIWATLNHREQPIMARGYMRLKPGEAMIHDIVTGEYSRGMGIGAFMVEQMAQVLIDDYAVPKIVIDVNIWNTSSLRMVSRAGIPKIERVFYISALGGLAFSKVLRRYKWQAR